MTVHKTQLRSMNECHTAAERQEHARHSRASEEVMRDRMLEAKSTVEEERVSKRELTNGECGLYTDERYFLCLIFDICLHCVQI